LQNSTAKESCCTSGFYERSLWIFSHKILSEGLSLQISLFTCILLLPRQRRRS